METVFNMRSYLGNFQVHKLDPMPINYILRGQKCFFCAFPVVPGDVFCLIPTHPADQREFAKMLLGREYACIHNVAHWECMCRYIEEKRHGKA